MNKNIKWGCIQPLTGGMYLGAEEAIGHPASWIISFEGLDSVKYDKDNTKIISAGNEYNLLQYLKKVNREVPYFKFDCGMFDDKPISEVNISGTPDFNDIDIVVSVPVCSGLSKAAVMATAETRATRNCNMKWITKYTLSVIKPKVFIFENAPDLMNHNGDSTRHELETLAIQNGYSICYFKTDTKLHNNCQKRPRTFVLFQKWTGNQPMTPSKMNFIANTITAQEYLAQIPANASQQIPYEMSVCNKLLLGYCKEKFGNNWRDSIHRSPMNYITANNLYNDFKEYISRTDDSPKAENVKKWLDHVKYKTDLGLNYYSDAIICYDKLTPGIQFRTLRTVLHHNEDRHFTTREALWLMGMPHDFELYGDFVMNGRKIGQNVPVGTAKYIVGEAVRWIENWDNDDRTSDSTTNSAFYDNTKQKQIW